MIWCEIWLSWHHGRPIMYDCFILAWCILYKSWVYHMCFVCVFCLIISVGKKKKIRNNYRRFCFCLKYGTLINDPMYKCTVTFTQFQRPRSCVNDNEWDTYVESKKVFIQLMRFVYDYLCWPCLNANINSIKSCKWSK